MKNNCKHIIVFLLLLLTSCEATGNRYESNYGNRKILKEEKNIKVGDKISDVQSIIGSPSRTSKSSLGGDLYEYEYHDASRSLVYFVPVVSVFYNLFTMDIFTLSGKNVLSEVDHNYLFLETDNNGIVRKKDFVKDQSLQKFYQRNCSANSFGARNCGDYSIDKLIEY